MGEKLGLGIIGAGWMADMASEEIVKLDTVELAGVCARHLEKALGFAEKYNIPFACGSVDELLARPEIEAVYIATLNDSHCEIACKAILAGKAVIIEKPFALNAQESRKIIDLAKQKKVFAMEAMWTRFFPSSQYIRLLIESGAIGALKSASMNMCLKMDRQANARVFMKEHGGGVLVDIGVYAVNFVQMITGIRPAAVENKIEFSDTGVDMTDHLTVKYENGFTAEIEVNGLEEMPPVAQITGEKGTIRFEGGLMSGKFILETNAGKAFYDLATERFRYPYYYQFEHLARCIRDGKMQSDRISLDDTLQVMEIMDSARHAGGFYYPQEEE